MTYKRNTLGGWIVPPWSVVPCGTVFPKHSDIGDLCAVGDGCTIGKFSNIGNGCAFGYDCEIMAGSIVGAGCSFLQGCTYAGTPIQAGDKIGAVAKTAKIPSDRGFPF